MSATPVAAQAPARQALPRPGVVGLALLGLLVAVAVAAPLLAPYMPNARVGVPFSPPSAAHLLGTNDVGHDLLTELVYGAQVSLAVGLVAAVTATVIGTLVGVTAGALRGWVDTALMRLVDVLLALPLLPLTIVVGVFIGPGLATQIAVIGAVLWAAPARVLRAQVLSVRELDHVEAARAMGASRSYTIRRHLLPEVAPLVVGQLVLAARLAILLEASLSFLGLGDAVSKSWGTTLSFAHARSAFLTDAWLWWVLPPGVCITAAVLALALVGYAVEERARPVLARGRVRARRLAPAAPVAVDGRAADAILRADGLSVAYGSAPDAVVAVDLAVRPGEIVGLVGESGSGKSTLVAAALGLLRPPAHVTAGRVRVCGKDLAALPERELRRLRGDRVALVPQQAAAALNPVYRVGDQLAEAVRLHRPVGRREAAARAATLLRLVGIDPDRASAYPHELSGGMRQRVVIAMALANEPALVVADEPTAGLDVVIQAEILGLLAELRRRLGLALLVVSHDLPAVLRLADRVAVMRAGRIVELAPAAQLATAPAHPYSRALLAATPRLPDPLLAPEWQAAR